MESEHHPPIVQDEPKNRACFCLTGWELREIRSHYQANLAAREPC